MEKIIFLSDCFKQCICHFQQYHGIYEDLHPFKYKVP